MKNMTSILKALADETRFQIINLLLTHDLCVGALANCLTISKAAVSQHLQVLRKAGLVRGEKRGYWTHYIVERNVLKKIADRFTEMANHISGPEGVCLRTLTIMPDNFKERRKIDMCKDCCQQPEKLKGKPEDCTPEQIKECHGDTENHPCETEKK
jgi:ArsR family transcriptional regulator